MAAFLLIAFALLADGPPAPCAVPATLGTIAEAPVAKAVLLPWDLAFATKFNGFVSIARLSKGKTQILKATMALGVAEQPAWSPDGTRIAFSGKRDGKWNIYVLTLGSAQLKQLTSTQGPDTFPAWSPDGRTIAFMSETAGFTKETNIYLVDADGKNERRLPLPMHNPKYPSWSPDGKFLAFSGPAPANQSDAPDLPHKTFDFAQEIFIASKDGKQIRQLTNEHAVCMLPTWSPTGNVIAFCSNRDGPTNQLVDVHIYTMSTDGSRLKRLTHGTGQRLAPKWSPDGRKIAFHSRDTIESDLVAQILGGNFFPRELFRGRPDPESSTSLYMMDADGSHLERLTNGDTDCFFPAWRPR